MCHASVSRATPSSSTCCLSPGRCLLLLCGLCTAFPDVQVSGFADDPASVLPGDMYCCVERITRSSVWNGHAEDAVKAALEAGAVAILAQASAEFPPGLVPDSIPIIYADEVEELATRLAAVLYGEFVVFCVSRVCRSSSSSSSL